MVVAPFLLPLAHLFWRFRRAASPDAAVAGASLCVRGTSCREPRLWRCSRDPFRDRHCWSNCTDNMFLVRAEPELDRSLTVVLARFRTRCRRAARSCVCRGGSAVVTDVAAAARSLLPVIGPIAVADGDAMPAGLLLPTPPSIPERQSLHGGVLRRSRGARRPGCRDDLGRATRACAHVGPWPASPTTSAPPRRQVRCGLRSPGLSATTVSSRLLATRTDSRYVDASGQPVDLAAGPTQA